MDLTCCRLLPALPLLFGLACSGQGPTTITAVLPLSGAAEVYGREVRAGLELGLAELRERDGLTFALLVEDSGSDPQRARALLDQRLPESWAAVGGVTSAEALAMVPVAEKQGRVLLSPSASSDDLSGRSRFFYRLAATDTEEAARLSSYAVNTLRLARVAILAADSPAGQGKAQAFQKRFADPRRQVEIITYPAGTEAFGEPVGRALQLRPDGVYVADLLTPTLALVRQLRGAGFQGRILATSALATPAVTSAGSLVDGILFAQVPLDLAGESPEVRRFAEAYRARHGGDPGLYAALGYEAAMVLAAARREAGSPLPTDLWKGMRSIRDLPALTGTINFDERGDVKKFPRVYWIHEGRFGDFEKYVEQRLQELRDELDSLQDQQDQLDDHTD